MRRIIRALPRRQRLRALTRLELWAGTVDVELRRLGEYLPADRRRTALDIGANNGVTASVLAPLFGQVHAFEPNPRMVDQWRDTAPVNVAVRPLALSNHDGEATLSVPVVGELALAGWASLGRPGLEEVDRLETVRVECRRLDGLPEADLPIDFMKIDVEGHELAVLEGAANCIRRWRPWLVIEAWPAQKEALTARLLDWGYELVCLKSEIGADVKSQNLVLRPTS